MSIPRSAPATQPSEEKTHSGDEAGPVIGEYDDTGTVIREYIWLGDRPVAMLENGNVYYIHTDHLNTPQVVTDDTQTVVWKGDYTPFGEVEETVSTIEFNLRFPGQFYDAETGLNYNYFRSYDASIGRYVQPDPIGVNGGLNLYSYVNGSPFLQSDRYGLAPAPICKGTDCVSPPFDPTPEGPKPSPRPDKPKTPKKGPMDPGWCADNNSTYTTCHACCQARAQRWPQGATTLSICIVKCMDKGYPDGVYKLPSGCREEEYGERVNL